MMWLGKAIRYFVRTESGATAVYFALLAPVLIGFSALGGEVGLWLLTERRLQHITDMAAISAATRAHSTSTIAEIRASATARAVSSGLRPTDTLTITIPPATGPNAGKSYFAEATAQRSVPRYLTALFNPSGTPVVISARSVAGPGSGGEPACMMALSPTASPAFSAGGAGTINVIGCAFSTNSSASNSFDMIGARVTVTGSCLYSVGGVEINDNLTLTDCDEPQTDQRPMPDPYANLPMPDSATIAGITRRSGSSVGASFTPTDYLIAYPGMPVAVFGGGLTLSSTTSLGAGVYIVDGGTLKIGANAKISGKGVTFYLLNGATLDVAGGAELDISAYDRDNPGLRTDPFAGILFFADRTAPPLSHSLSGNSTSAIDGVIYFPNDTLTYTGNSGSSYPCLQIIASQLAVTGSGTVTIGCEPSRPPGAPQAIVGRSISLFE
jgi:hypothetical protein